MLSVLFYHCAGIERTSTKARAVKIQSHCQSHTEDKQSSVICIHEFDFTIFFIETIIRKVNYDFVFVNVFYIENG